MVEIAKALSFNSRVLIMDEPTAALNNAEIDELFRIIRDFKSRGVGIVYISHRLEELKQISDRITVMRDGKYVDTVPTETTSIDDDHHDDGRPHADETFRATRSASRATKWLLEVKGLNCGALVKDVSFALKRGEILGFAGLMGAGRTEVARAVFGADRAESGEIRVRGKKVPVRTPSDAVAVGIGYLSEDRKRFGLALGMDVDANMVMANLARFLVVPLLPARADDFRRGGEVREAARHPDAVG